MYGCESWTIKKVEHWRIDAFKLCCWRRLLRVPWTARRSSQSTLKEISPDIHWKDWCCSWNSDTLATWCKNWLIWKDPDAGKDWRWGEKGTTEEKMVGWHHRLYGHEFEQALGVGDEQGGLAWCSPWGCKELDMTEQLIKCKKIIFLINNKSLNTLIWKDQQPTEKWTLSQKVRENGNTSEFKYQKTKI